MLPENNIKEGISFSYVKAVANIAGYSIEQPHNDYGIDATVKEIEARPSGKLFDSGINLDLQIKSTCNFRQDETCITYDLRNKNYNDLVNTSSLTPRILVVLCMPQEKAEWVKHNAESLIMKKCAYWAYIGGKPQVPDNDSTTAIRIEKSKVFSPETLQIIIEKIKRKEDLNDL